MNNNDEWCYLDSENGSERSPSFDIEEPEIELEPMYVEEVCAPKRAEAATNTKKEVETQSNQDAEDGDDDAVDVVSLLSDTKVAGPGTYGRDTMLSMLAPTHQRYVTMGTQTATVTSPSRKRTVREAFVAPSHRQQNDPSTTYADRLRAAMPSRESFAGASVQVELTAVKPFTRDQATQTASASKAEVGKRSHVALLASALERSLDLSLKLKTKSQDAETFDIRAMRLQIQLNERTRERDAIEKELLTAQRGLRISRKRSELSEEFQDHLKRQIEQLRLENISLRQSVEVLAGGLSLDSKSVAELERLEDSLSDAAAKVRLALRAKYREAIAGEPTEMVASGNQADEATEGCVVCLENLACVRLEPCGHEVLCSQCAVRVTTCPVDREPISNQILTYGLNIYTSS